jgi:ketosteroid isomerase-like protein
MATDEEVVRGYIAAISAGDLDGIGAAITDDVVVHIPGRGPTAGVKRGRDEALDMFRLMAERAGGTMVVDVHDLLSSDDHVVALVSRSIAGVEAPAAVIYHLRDGKIAGVWSHEWDQYALDEAMGS